MRNYDEKSLNQLDYRWLVTPWTRRTVATLILAIAIGVRVPLLAGAMQIHTTNCPNVFESKQVVKGDLMDETWYPTYDLIVQIFQVFVSFAVLLALNVFIIRKLKRARDEIRRKSVHASQANNGYDRLGGSDAGFIAKQLKQVRQLSDKKSNRYCSMTLLFMVDSSIIRILDVSYENSVTHM